MSEQKKKIRILLVDDEPLTLRVFGGKLSNKGFEILYAHDGNEGREVARRMEVDLILLDFRMPVMDGIETLERLKGEKITKNIPIIMLTSEDLSRDAEKAIKDLGADDYIQKGTTTDNLVKRINKVLRSQKDKSKKLE